MPSLRKKLFSSILENISVQRLGLFSLSLKSVTTKLYLQLNFKGSDVVAFCYDFNSLTFETELDLTLKQESLMVPF